MLLTDRPWLKRLNGEGEHPNQLDSILYEDRAEPTGARLAFDAAPPPAREAAAAAVLNLGGNSFPI
jgi:hypothetical protein